MNNKIILVFRFRYYTYFHDYRRLEKVFCKQHQRLSEVSPLSFSHISEEYEMKFDESIDQSRKLNNSSIKESLQHKNFRGSMGNSINKQQPPTKNQS